ncbi:ATP-binding protein [Ornithinimicrobium cerasi]|uniref:ATP-binding protein n=1 Tax=Ornithinimicrobium cerasi TaxID=2248773 RepID=UPI001379BD76|nr:tetratricopeptide repeat protein [Ornithinimicrobium cerasi]
MTAAPQPGPALPSGRVTFLMTDIEGSTRLFQGLGRDYVALLAQHNALLRAAFARHGGAELDTEGDALIVAFADPTEAVVACVEGQVALREHPWPPGAAIRVRMGLDTADAAPVDGQYVSLALHRASRICAGGHGGQVLLSETTAVEVRGRLPSDVMVTALGRFQLRGFAEPTRLFQVAHPALPVDFPPLRAQGVVHHNLPFHRAGLVGRAGERAALARAIHQTGIVTVVGTGGVGKTRLAVQVAFDVMDDFEDGTWLVELASATGRQDVASAVAGVLHVTGRPGASLEEAVLDELSTRSALVVLDNCEQVADTVAGFAEELAQRAPRVVLVATSREPLGVEGEVVWRLGPLPVPHPAEVTRAAQLVDLDGVRLFAERATLVRPGFTVTDDNAGTVARIVAHVDGIPLAIELAAAALADRSPESVLAGLADRFALLVDGRRTAPERHQALRSALVWSLDLLCAEERLLFARLGAFARTGTIEDTSEVCGAAPLSAAEVPRLLRRLVRASLLTLADDHERWSMLESVQELAGWEARCTGEAAVVAERHRERFASRAETLGPQVGLRGRRAVVTALLADLDNVRRALATGVEAADTDRCLRLATGMTRFWMSRGDWSAGVGHLQQALALPGGADRLRAPALDALGSLLMLRGSVPDAEDALLEAEAVARSLGDHVTLARSLSGLGYVAFRRSELDVAETRWREALLHAERAGDERVVAGILRSLAIAVASRHDQEGASALLDRAIGAAERAQDDQQLRLVLSSKAEAQIWLGRYAAAQDLYTQALDLAVGLEDRPGQALLLAELGWVALLAGDVTTAVRLANQAVASAEDLENPRVLASALRVRAEAKARQDRPDEADRDLTRALPLAERQGDPAEISGVRCSLAYAALEQLHLDEARAHATAAAGLSALQHTLRLVFPQWVLGVAALVDGDLEVASSLFWDAVNQSASGGAPRHQAASRWGLARVSAAAGDLGQAARLHREALVLRRRVGDRLGVAESLLGSAEVVATADAATAAVLVGAAERLLNRLGAALTPRLAADLASVPALVGHELVEMTSAHARGIPEDEDEDEAEARAEAALRAVEALTREQDADEKGEGHGLARG